jgi:glycosyltransferase involved in cell wall biosynthesis/ADP-heptose:LPS heptosyltransferase
MIRIVIDMQGAQTESRFRGIGRYTMSLVQAIVRNKGDHEIILVLNDLFQDTIEPIRATFGKLLPQENIRVFYVIGPTRECDPDNFEIRAVAESVREAFIACLKPDVVLVTSHFEGLGDDAVVSIKDFDTSTPTAIILYDLIPLISPDKYFRESSIHRNYYSRKIESLKKSDMLLAISESSRSEALEALQFDPTRVINISSGCDSYFRRVLVSEKVKKRLYNSLGIKRPFLMYTGGADERKNLHRLIKAFSLLPRSIRLKTQLVFVGKIQEEDVEAFKKTASNSGLNQDELLFTGYVSDDELIMLYSSCELFVFPSIHEGFGLPPLEAMGCGAPVITSNVSSLPEVIGRDDAMFDPFSVGSIKKKLLHLLTDQKFKNDLIEYGAKRVQEFTWDKSAKKAIKMLEQIARPSMLENSSLTQVNVNITGVFKPIYKKILVSKLDHMGDLVLAIPALMKLRARYPYAKIDALIGSWNVEVVTELSIFDNIYTLDFFEKKSSMTADANKISLTECTQHMPQYDLAIDLRRQADTRFILLKIPATYRVGYSAFDENIDKYLDLCLPSEPDQPFKSTSLNNTSICLQMLHLVDALPNELNDFIRIPTRLTQQLNDIQSVAIFPYAGNEVKEWGIPNYVSLISLLDDDQGIKRISVYVLDDEQASSFVNKSWKKVFIFKGQNYRSLLNSLSEHGICIANNSLGAHLGSLLGLKVIGIYSGQEVFTEWAPVFGRAYVIHYPIDCSPCHIAKRNDCQHDFKCLTGISAENVYSVLCAARLRGEATTIIKTVDGLVHDLIQKIAPKLILFSNEQNIQLAECIDRNTAVARKKRLHIDCSELVVRDSKTGIQRVVKSILKFYLTNSNGIYDIVPVYADTDTEGYHHARRFSTSFLGLSVNEIMKDDWIDFQPGDIFLGLDFQPAVVFKQKQYFTKLRNHGVKVIFVVYDILCVKMPQYFQQSFVDIFKNWLQVVVESDGVICISEAVKIDFLSWLEEHPATTRERSFLCEWFHLGADIVNSNPSKGNPDDANRVLQQIKNHTLSFLMVGTIEPRKGYSQVLEAFEMLWQDNNDYCLVIVGKKGWKVDALINKIRYHTELHKRLYWLDSISDEFLEKIYTTADCLIAASEGEGFGLPLIEAAKIKLPIIARDIPVFREVARQHAYYFINDILPSVIVAAIKDWKMLYHQGSHPRSEMITWLTWAESSNNLLTIISNELAL